MKILKSLLASSILATSIVFPTNAFAEEQITVSIDNQKLTFDVPPVIEDGSTLVPFRTIFEKLDLSVGWNTETNTVTGNKDGLTIQLKIGDKSSIVNGRAVSLDVPPKVIDGTTLVPLRFVAEASKGKVVWHQETRHIDIFFDQILNLHNASFSNDAVRLKSLLDSGVSVEAEKDFYTPLMKAVLGNAVDSVNQLISFGANVNAIIEEELVKDVYTTRTPLGLANESAEITKILLDAGANPNISMRDGNTILLDACANPDVGSNGYPEVIKLLLKAGAKPNVSDNLGWTPLLRAAAYGHEEVVEVLLENGADPNFQTVAKNDGVIKAQHKLKDYLNGKSIKYIFTKDKNFNYTWGASESQVRAVYSEEPSLVNKTENGNTQFIYNHVFDLGEKGKVRYTFGANGLSEVLFMTDSHSEFEIPYGVFTGQVIDLSEVYNNGEIPNTLNWDVGNITVDAYKKLYGNDVRGMSEMAIRSNELVLNAPFESYDSNILVSMYNSGTSEKPSYIASIRYIKK